MFKFLIGIILGIVIATIGVNGFVNGMSNIAQSGVSKVQNAARDAAQ